MITTNHTLTKIKETKSVGIYYDELYKVVRIEMLDSNMPNVVCEIQMSKVFSVQRGLLTAIQKFYRRKIK